MNGNQIPKSLYLLPLLALFWLDGLLAASTVISDTALYRYPSSSAPVITYLSAGQQVTQLARSGGWKQIRANEKSGWIRGYLLRGGITTSSNQKEASSSGFLSILASLSRKTSGLFSNNKPQGISTRHIATIGIRGRNVSTIPTDTGLTAQHLQSAKPDFAELNTLEQYRSNSEEALAFARQGSRKAVSFTGLPRTGMEQ